MDGQGFIPLSLFTSFPRLKALTQDPELIRYVCQQPGSIMECHRGVDGQDRIRVKGNWQQWVLPVAQRVESARHDGVEVASNVPPPQPAIFHASQYPGSRHASNSMASPEVPHTANGAYHQDYFRGNGEGPVNGAAMNNGNSQQQPFAGNGGVRAPADVPLDPTTNNLKIMYRSENTANGSGPAERQHPDGFEHANGSVVGPGTNGSSSHE